MSSSVSQTLPERYCRVCHVRLSRYNPTDFCWACQDGRRGHGGTSVAPFTPPSAPLYQSAFTLRSILDTVQRTRPVRLSDVGHVLKHYRTLHHLTQRDLAAMLGFDQSYISKLENGQNLRDIAVLTQIAQRLNIPEQWLGLAPNSTLDLSTSELVEIAPSVIRLCQTVRETGRADAAVNELWPLTLRLETLADQHESNPRLLLTLATAQAVLGIILGDLMPEEDLWVSVSFFKKAVAIVDELGNDQMRAEMYRGYGNELRKQKEHTQAHHYLEQALFLAQDDISRGIAAVLLARTYGEMGNREHFADVIRTALHFQDATTHFTPTFNPITVQEVQMRGWLHIQQSDKLPPLLEHNSTSSIGVSVAPQWYVISQLTTAQALCHLGKVDDGVAKLQAALVGAELCRLPQQVQRAIRTLQTVEAFTPAQTLLGEAKQLFHRLSSYTQHIPSPQQ